ncbi:MAG: class I SAM-dependent methyltransferase [Acidobacteriota bacterium]
MPAEQPIDDLLARLERERLAADRQYNDALTAVDRALQEPPALPDPPRAYDDSRLEPINQAWQILPDGPPPIDRSLKGRLRGLIWRLVGPPIGAQQRFNAEIVDHLNRNAAAHRELQQSASALLTAAGHQFASLARFESLLVQYLQTITAYVDTRDRRGGGDELRERVTLAEQRVLALKRELERRPASGSGAAASAASQSAAAAFTAPVDSLTYVGFEDRFRGSQDEIRTRVEDYLPILASASDVLDVGCGRGELLDLLRQHGVRARGVDVNDAMVELCRARGLEVDRDEALRYLERQPDGSIGGLIAIQVVEHFAPAYLLRVLETAHHKMRPGAPLVLETINPACWMAFFECYLRDVTHRQALHPDTLRYLVQTSGFTNVDVQFRSPISEADRLARISGAAEPTDDPRLAALVTAVNAHADTLNARLFSSMDYAVIARR